MEPVNRGSRAETSSALGARFVACTGRPSASSVSVSMPHVTVNTYDFCPSMTNGTVLVASPRAIGRIPDARGSSVPAWPAFLAFRVRFATATACVEVMPTPLSSTSQPCTSRLLGRCSRGGRCSVGSVMCSLLMWELPALSRLRCDSELALTLYATGKATSAASGRGSLLVVLRQLLGVLTNFLGAQERIDLGRLIEAVVTAEAQVRRELEVHAMRDLLSERLAVAV